MTDAINYEPAEAVLRRIAERIVDKAADPRYSLCPCCGYDGMWPSEREEQIDGVIEMLKTGFGT